MNKVGAKKVEIGNWMNSVKPQVNSEMSKAGVSTSFPHNNQEAGENGSTTRLKRTASRLYRPLFYSRDNNCMILIF